MDFWVKNVNNIFDSDVALKQQNELASKMN